MDATLLTFLFIIFFNLMTDVRERRKGAVFFNVLWINSIFKMDLSNIHPIFIYRESLVTANRKQRYIRSPLLWASILITFDSWVNSYFYKLNGLFPAKSVIFPWVSYVTVKNKLGWSRTQKPVLRQFSFFTVRSFLWFYSRWHLSIMK